MKKNYLIKWITIVLIFIATLSKVHAQNQDKNWYFGGVYQQQPTQRAGLDFNNIIVGIPTALTNSDLEFSEGSACMSDNNGKLLFYTNGNIVYNRCHTQMPNGFGLGGHWSSMFPALIVPNPANDNQYYVFSNDGNPTGTGAGLFHSMVDMTLDNNRGDVLAAGKKTFLLSNTSELLQGAIHSNGVDYWAITIDYLSAPLKIYAYRISALGVSAPVITDMATGFNMNGAYIPYWFKMSHDSKKAVLWAGGEGVRKNLLLNFDNTTGIFTYNNTFGVLSNMFTGIGQDTRKGCFSPDDNFYYCFKMITPYTNTFTSQLVQYPITGLNSTTVPTVIKTNVFEYKDLRAGPDNKIYVIGISSNLSLSRINSPNLAGVACNFIEDEIPLAGRTASNTLPNKLLKPNHNYSLPTTINITANPPTGIINPAQSITFTATTNAVIAMPSLQWQINGVNVVGATNNTFTTTVPTVTNGSVVSCIINDCQPIVSNQIIVSVTTTITPTFTQVAPICEGSPLAALPTTSTNGITGSWSPTLMNNLATTTYIFTPTAGQNATTAQMTIVVNPNTTPTFTQVTPICSGGTLAALPTTSNNGITGTWAPAVNNTATTTYTFTPTAGLCATTQTMTIVVNPNITPTFTQVAPICVGGTLAALPTTSNNGITGTWAPAVNNTATTTYTFTPTAGICATTQTMTIVVNPNITPTFTQVAPICVGGTLTALPTISNNGITGTWVPALNNTVTTTYTFTPNAGLCAATSTMTISVNPIPNITVNNPTICQDQNATVTCTLNPPNVNYTYNWNVPAGANNPGNVNNFTTSTPGNYTVSVTQNPNLCNLDFETAVPGLNSNPPNFILTHQSNISCWQTTAPDEMIELWYSGFSGVNAYSGNQFAELNANIASNLYQDITVLPGTESIISFAHRGRLGLDTMAVEIGPVGGQFISLGNFSTNNTNWVLYSVPYTFPNNGITNYRLRFVAISSATNNLGIGNFIDSVSITSTFCPSTATSIVTVNPIVTPTFTQVAPICVGGTLAALPTTSDNGITGAWAPAVNNNATTTYTFTPTAGLCATTQTMTITVNPNITPAFTQVAPICVGGSLASLPTTSDNGITGTWAPAVNNTATTTYTFTPNAGLCATTQTMTITVNPNITPTFIQVAPICVGGTFAALPTTSDNGITGTWAPAINNTATTTYTFTPTAGLCATTQTMTIVVNPNITPAFTQVAPICSGGTLAALPTTSDNGITGTWTPALDNSATTTYTFTPTAGLCATTQTMTIVVNPNITPIFTQVAPICSGGTLVALPTTSNNGITGTWAPALDNTATTTYTFTPTAGLCATMQTMTITVNPIPDVRAVVENTEICSGSKVKINLANNFPNTIFTWNVDLTQTFGATGFNPGTGSLINDTLTATGTTNGQVTYVVTPNIANCIGNSISITIIVKPLPLAFGTNNLPEICSGETPNISIQSPNPLTAFSFVAFPSPGITGAVGGNTFANPNGLVVINTLINAQTLVNNGNTQGFVDYIFTPTLNNCNGTAITIRVRVNPLPKPVLNNGVICIDATGNVFQNYVLNAGLDNANHTFTWTFTPLTGPVVTLAATTNSITANQVGTYTVIAKNTTTNCSSTPVPATVTSSLPATAINAQVSEMFSGAATVTVQVTGGTGTYLYQLGDGNFQNSPKFTNVSPGVHVIKVIDTQGCTYLTTTILVVDYMQFFTPNGDGYQDVWKVIGLNQDDAKIYIFDRYGKLLQQISGSENTDGWSGTYNGQPMPATDYWFTIEYKENNTIKVFKAHFTLKR